MKYVTLTALALVSAVLATLSLAAVQRGPVVRTLAVGGHTVVVREAPELKLPPAPGSPVGFDCNNAMLWDRDTLYCFVSHEHPFRSSGRDLYHLEDPPTRVRIDGDPSPVGGGHWIEAVHKVAGGRLYMWYHHEPRGVIPGKPHLTVPTIGQMYSDDNGLNWKDQGVILEAPADSRNSETANRFFAGGHGDFSVIADREGRDFYFLFSTYGRDVRDQGVAIARARAADLANPVGRVVKWYQGRWEEPGLGGRATPIFPAEADWHTDGARAFWGPAVHWNHHIQSYVVLVNKAIDSGWKQDGVYLSVNPRLDDPAGWSEPRKLLDVDEWYPQVVGTDAEAHETDREAGRSARLFVSGKSKWWIEFH